jgi:hypothetical protein
VPADLQSVPFDPVEPKAALAQIPPSAAVFALYGADAHAEPYIGRTPNLRGRLERLLQPSPRHPRRLQLAGRVRRIAYHLSGSDFESLLAQFALLEQVYGAKALDRIAPASAKPTGPTVRSPPAPPPSASPTRPSSYSSFADALTILIPTPLIPAAFTPR